MPYKLHNDQRIINWHLPFGIEHDSWAICVAFARKTQTQLAIEVSLGCKSLRHRFQICYVLSTLHIQAVV